VHREYAGFCIGKLFGINAACYFVMLQAAAMILAFWR
jgi:hypothetical protein